MVISENSNVLTKNKLKMYYFLSYLFMKVIGKVNFNNFAWLSKESSLTFKISQPFEIAFGFLLKIALYYKIYLNEKICISASKKRDFEMKVLNCRYPIKFTSKYLFYNYFTSNDQSL